MADCLLLYVTVIGDYYSLIRPYLLHQLPSPPYVDNLASFPNFTLYSHPPCLQVTHYHLSHHAFIPIFYQPSTILLHTSCISLPCKCSILILPFFHSPIPSIPTSQSKILLVWRVTVRQMVSVVLTFFSLLSGQRAWRTIPLLL